MTKKEKIELLTLLDEQERRKAKVDYFTFLKRMSPPEFKWNWHHKYVCSVLQEWITTDNFPFLMIFMPPQHQKSTMLTEYLPAWAFGHDINYQMLLVMYNSLQAKKYNRKIQRIMCSEEYKKIFPNTRLNDKNVGASAEGSYVKNSDEFEVVGGRGFLKATGVGGGIAGNPAKVALLDDVIKNVEEANSETYRNRTHDWYTDELEARIHNDSKIAFTITRRHVDDQAGRLLKRDGVIEEGGKWKVIKLPAIKEDNSNPDDPREIGEALFPALHSLDRMLYKQKHEPRTFASLYQQEPYIKGGNMIQGDWFRRMNEKELPFNMDDVIWHAVIDGAFTDKAKNDATAIGYYHFDKKDKIVYIRGIKDFRKKLSDAVNFIAEDAPINGLNSNSRIDIELKASGHGLLDLLFTYGFNTMAISDKIVRLGKKTRVEQVEPSLSSGRVVLIESGNWIKPFLYQCEAFPNDKHDDMVDVLCYIIFITLITGVNPYRGRSKRQSRR